MGSLAKPFISSQQAALPAISGTPGALLAALRAVLVTGAGSANVQTLVVSGGVATLTFAANHSYIVSSVALIEGADQPLVNGEARVIAIPSPTSIQVATAAADGTATGSITAKIAPAGWSEVYTGTNVARFKSPAIESHGMVLHVDDTGTRDARIVAYESESDAAAGTNPVPTAAQMPGGLYWGKSYTENATVRPWVAFVDDRGIYFGVGARHDVGTIQGRIQTYYAGDFESLKPGDAWGWVVSGNPASATTAASVGNVARNSSTPSGGIFVARGISGLAGAVSVGLIGAERSTNAWSGNSSYSYAGTYPNPANNGLQLSRVELLEGGAPRGLLPGLFHARQNLAGSIDATGVRISGSAELPDASLISVFSGNMGSSSAGDTGVVFFNAAGVWSR